MTLNLPWPNPTDDGATRDDLIYIQDGVNDHLADPTAHLGATLDLDPTLAAGLNSTVPSSGVVKAYVGANGGGVALGETSTTAYRGDRGKTAYDTALLAVPKGSLVFNVKDYGALGNGTHDDTAAIQAALDAASGVGVVYIPPTPGARYMFSNLKLPAYTKLIGASTFLVSLTRIAGSTGTAIREKTAAEGNSHGCIGMVVGGFLLDGDGTAGNGLDLGNAGGADIQSTGQIYDVYVADFPSGTAININSNACYFRHLWGMSSEVGINLSGAGSGGSFYNGLWAENNTSRQIVVGEPYAHVFGVQVESNVEDTNPLVEITAGGVAVNGVYTAWQGSTTKPELIYCRQRSIVVRDVINAGAGPFTHGIFADTPWRGTGTDPMIFECRIGDTAVGSTWYINSTTSETDHSTGGVTTLGSDLIAPGLMAARLPATDHTANGLKTTAVAKQAQAIGDAVCVGSDGKWTLAKADAIANAKAIAMVCDATIAQDATGNYLLHGTIRDDTWAWTVGGLIYLSVTGTTANTLTQTAPAANNNVVQILGVATAADEMIFAPGALHYDEVVA